MVAFYRRLASRPSKVKFPQDWFRKASDHGQGSPPGQIEKHGRKLWSEERKAELAGEEQEFGLHIKRKAIEEILHFKVVVSLASPNDENTGLTPQNSFQNSFHVFQAERLKG